MPVRLRFNTSLPGKLNEFAILIQARLWTLHRLRSSSGLRWRSWVGLPQGAELCAIASDSRLRRIYGLGEQIAIPEPLDCPGNRWAIVRHGKRSRHVT